MRTPLSWYQGLEFAPHRYNRGIQATLAVEVLAWGAKATILGDDMMERMTAVFHQRYAHLCYNDDDDF